MTNNTTRHSARIFINQNLQGVLATVSDELSGYPFGSAVPFCFDRTGQIIVLVSHLAQHSKNIQRNSKVSLTLLPSHFTDIQTATRLTYVADAQHLVDDAEALQRYYRYYPSARDYHLTMGFMCYRLVLVKARFIAGFGQISWLDRGELLHINPFSEEEEKVILATIKEKWRSQAYAEIVGVDGEGFHTREDGQLVYHEFKLPVVSLEQAVAEIDHLIT